MLMMIYLRLPCLLCQRSMAAVIFNPLMGAVHGRRQKQHLIKMNCNLTRLISIRLSHCVLCCCCWWWHLLKRDPSFERRTAPVVGLLSGGGGMETICKSGLYINVHTNDDDWRYFSLVAIVSINYLHKDSHNNVLGKWYSHSRSCPLGHSRPRRGYVLCRHSFSIE